MPIHLNQKTCTFAFGKDFYLHRRSLKDDMTPISVDFLIIAQRVQVTRQESLMPQN